MLFSGGNHGDNNDHHHSLFREFEHMERYGEELENIFNALNNMASFTTTTPTIFVDASGNDDVDNRYCSSDEGHCDAGKQGLSPRERMLATNQSNSTLPTEISSNEDTTVMLGGLGTLFNGLTGMLRSDRLENIGRDGHITTYHHGNGELSPVMMTPSVTTQSVTTRSTIVDGVRQTITTTIRTVKNESEEETTTTTTTTDDPTRILNHINTSETSPRYEPLYMRFYNSFFK